MTIETRDLTKAEIEFLSDKCEKLEKQLKIAKQYLEFIYTDTKNGHFPCNACGYEIYCEGCINQEWAEQALEQIEELDK